jgi:hypothetical protein
MLTIFVRPHALRVENIHGIQRIMVIVLQQVAKPQDVTEVELPRRPLSPKSTLFHNFTVHLRAQADGNV